MYWAWGTRNEINLYEMEMPCASSVLVRPRDACPLAQALAPALWCSLSGSLVIRHVTALGPELMSLTADGGTSSADGGLSAGMGEMRATRPLRPLAIHSFSQPFTFSTTLHPTTTACFFLFHDALAPSDCPYLTALFSAISNDPML